MTDKWYDKTTAQVEETLGTSVSSGLDRKKVKSRRSINGTNEIYPIPRGTFKEYLKHILTDFVSLLLIITILLTAVFDRSAWLYTVLAVTVIYYVIAVLVYVKAQRVLEDMGQYSLPTAKVIREGKLYMVNQEALVQGDVIFLSTGDVVPADARLVECDDLLVLEVNVTSVAKSVPKDPSFIDHRELRPELQQNMLFASSIITSGTAKAIVCEIGPDTMVSKMKRNRPIVSHEKLAVFGTIRKYCKVWSLIMCAMIFVLTVIELIIRSGNSLTRTFITGITLAVSSMSEFYTAFVYILIAIGVFGAVIKFKDKNSGALIKNIVKLQTLKKITCLIVPKEGAFSVNDMKVERVYTGSESYVVGEHGFVNNCSQVLRYALLSTGLYGSAKLISNNQRNTNIYSHEEDAIILASEQAGIYNIDLEKQYPMLEHLSASEVRWDTTLVRYLGVNVVALRGDIEGVLQRCRFFSENGRVLELTPEKRSEISIAAALSLKEAYHVVAVASKNSTYNTLRRIGEAQSDMTFEGFLAIREPMLEGAAKKLSKLREAGIKVIMLTRDTTENNIYLAEAIGVVTNKRQIITGDELSRMKDGLFRANLDIYRLYEGLSLSQKRLLVKYLKDNGEVVGFLGNRLDDIILLREADVGFSQSVTLSGKANKNLEIISRRTPIYSGDKTGDTANGCEALKYISDVIISEAEPGGRGGFNAITDAVMYAKVIYFNMRRLMKYLLTTQFARIFLVLISLFSGVALIKPIQIIFSGLIIDFAAVLVIAFEKPSSDLLMNDDRLDEMLMRPVTANIESIFFGLFWAAISAVSVFIMNRLGIITTMGQASTCVFISMMITQMLVLSENMKERSLLKPNVRINRVYLLALLAVISVTAAGVLLPWGRFMFDMFRFNSYGWLGILAIPVVMFIVFEVYKLLANFSKKT